MLGMLIVVFRGVVLAIMGVVMLLVVNGNLGGLASSPASASLAPIVTIISFIVIIGGVIYSFMGAMLEMRQSSSD
jgi:hypothetical protein